MFKIFAWLQEISSVVRKHSRIFNLMLLHVFCLIQCTICSLWGQSASKRMKRHRRPSPTSYIDNLPHNPPPPPPHVHVLVCGIKIGESDRVGSSSSETHTSVCVFTPPPLHPTTLSPSLWWTPRWSWSSRLRPSPPRAGPLWCVCRHLSVIHTKEFN